MMETAEESATITKEKIAVQLKNDLGLSSLLCEDIILHVFSELLEIAQNTDKISLQNFGTWKINHKNIRTGFNLKTGASVPIEARTVLRFTPAKSMKQQINDGDAD